MIVNIILTGIVASGFFTWGHCKGYKAGTRDHHISSYSSYCPHGIPLVLKWEMVVCRSSKCQKCKDMDVNR